ncbi:MAG TPA: DUF934 domain-containing protein [Rhodoblastus sp.]|nr:DUF934 domain-containing protein [Rhodoblastus sp.]
MKLLDRAGYRIDDFARDGSRTATLTPLADLNAAIEQRDNRPIGAEIANNTDVERLAPLFERLALIAIVFPAFSDGRGFSLAKRLRQAGYKGRLRAVGPLIPDQGPYAFACGFDEIELPDAVAARQSEAQWRKALSAITLPYQPGYFRTQSILERRFEARRNTTEGARHA